jgi:hypothetical protein
VGEISQVVVAAARRALAQPVTVADEAAALQRKTRSIWMYSATAAAAVFLALLSSHALLGLFGQASLPRASAATLPPAHRAAAAKQNTVPATPQPSAASPQPIAAGPRRRAARARVRAQVPARPAGVESTEIEDAAVLNVEPDMSFMDEPITAREARAIAEGRARNPGKTAQPGTLRINSRPWAQLYVDGQLVGNTPQLGLRVSPGEHSIRLVNAQFEMSKTFSVFVEPGESVTRVESLGD